MHREIQRLVPLAILFLALLALFTALDIAESVLSPVVLGIVTGIVLSPLSELWERWGFPPVFGALCSLIVTLVAVGVVILLIQPLVAQLVSQAPKVLADMQDTIDTLSSTLRGLRNATEVVADALGDGAGPVSGDGGDDAAEGLPSVTDAILLAPSIVAQATIFAGVLFFFLLTRHELYASLARQFARSSDPFQVVARLRRAERHVSRYFLTVTLINVALGAATAATLHLIGLPNGLLWGLLAALFNFIVYLGPVIVSLALLVAGVAAFDGALSLAPALAFTALNFIESQFVTPGFIGRQMEMNPLVVFVALVFGMWLWGAVGGVVALPIAIWLRVMRDERRLSTAQLPENAVAAVTDEAKAD
jgi:predicted PurR-regulated permease PerM